MSYKGRTIVAALARLHAAAPARPAARTRFAGLQFRLVRLAVAVAAGSVLCALGPLPTVIGRSNYNLRSFGAVGDGHALDTAALQEAITSVPAPVAARSRCPPGNYLTGTLYLKSHVPLQLAAGAIILGSLRIFDYITDTFKTLYKNDPHLDRCLIFAWDAEDLAIAGRGPSPARAGSLEKGNPQKNRSAFIITGLPAIPLKALYYPISAPPSPGGPTPDAQNILAELDPSNLQGRWPKYSRFNAGVPAFGLDARSHPPGRAISHLHVRGPTRDGPARCNPPPV